MPTLSHWAIVGLFLVGVGTSLAGIQDWHDALTPVWWSGLLIQCGAIIKAIYTEKPGADPSAHDDD